MFGNKKDQKNVDDTENIKLDTTQIRADAGKRLDVKSQAQKTATVMLNEGLGIGYEYYSKEKKKNDSKNKHSDNDA